MSSNSKFKSNLESIKSDVDSLFKKIDNPSEKIFKHNMSTDVRLNGYHDPLSLYRNNEPTRSGKETRSFEEQNKRLNTQPGDIKYERDNRMELYPNSELREYTNIRNTVIENNTGAVPYKNASIRDNTLPYDVLLTEREKEEIRRRERERNREKPVTKEPSKGNSPKDGRDSRYNFYPNQQPSSEEERRNRTGDVFTHANERDRVPINPKETYRGSTYESTPHNQLDQEVTYDKRKDAINRGEINYPTGDTFVHAQQRDRVPINPKDLYRGSDYVSNPYSSQDLDVDKIPRNAMVNKTVDYMQNREFDINNDNRTSKDERDEITTIHTPYTSLDKFDKPNVVFKNINMEKPQVDVLNEYIVYIDTSDRNAQYYPNPFKVKVLFNPGSESGVSAPNPDLKIARSFENIKYLRLETTTFPRYYILKHTDVSNTDLIPSSYLGTTNEKTILDDIRYHIHNVKDITLSAFRTWINSTYNPTGGYETQFVDYIYTSPTNIKAKFNVVVNNNLLTPKSFPVAYELTYLGVNDITFKTDRYITDYTKDLSKDRYLIITIDEITENTQNSTGGKSAYNYLYPDYITDNYFYGDNHFVDKIFKNAKLGTIKNLTIAFYDSNNRQIVGGKFIDTISSTPNAESPEDNITADTTYNDCINYIRHPQYRNFQISLMFKVGCYETEIDKKIFY
jgi:hypothetical protein